MRRECEGQQVVAREAASASCPLDPLETHHPAQFHQPHYRRQSSQIYVFGNLWRQAIAPAWRVSNACAISATAVEKDRPLANASMCCPVVSVQNDSGFIFGGNG